MLYKESIIYPISFAMYAQSLQSCPTLCNPMDHGPSGSSVHGILQARILEWVAISFSSDKVWSEWSEVAQLCQTLCDPMDCSLPGSSVRGIFQVRMLEWVAIFFSFAIVHGQLDPHLSRWLYKSSNRNTNFITYHYMKEAVWSTVYSLPLLLLSLSVLLGMENDLELLECVLKSLFESVFIYSFENF